MVEVYQTPHKETTSAIPTNHAGGGIIAGMSIPPSVGGIELLINSWNGGS
jgi:hypothetical protein